MKPLLGTLVALLAAVALLPGVASSGIGMLAQRPISDFEATEDGGLVRWWVPDTSALDPYVDPIDGYKVYRAALLDGAGQPQSEGVLEIGSVAYHSGPQNYNFLDVNYEPGRQTVYFVRAFIGTDQGLPSNPVGDYPPCKWLKVYDEDPYVEAHPECLIP